MITGGPHDRKEVYPTVTDIGFLGSDAGEV